MLVCCLRVNLKFVPRVVAAHGEAQHLDYLLLGVLLGALEGVALRALGKAQLVQVDEPSEGDEAD